VTEAEIAPSTAEIDPVESDVVDMSPADEVESSRPTTIETNAEVSSLNQTDATGLVGMVSTDLDQISPSTTIIGISSSEVLEHAEHAVAVDDVPCSQLIVAGDMSSFDQAATAVVFMNEMETDVRIDLPTGAQSTMSSVVNQSLSKTNFNDLIPTPKSVRSQHRTKRAVAHAVVVTSSPFKKSLEEAKQVKEQKTAKQSAKNKKEKSSQNKVRMTSKMASKTAVETKGKTRAFNKRQRKVPSGRQLGKIASEAMNSDDDDLPLSALTSKHTSDDTRCKQCSVQYGDRKDPKNTEDLIKCTGPSCSAWLHETCAELYGVFDDNVYLCHNCLRTMIAVIYVYFPHINYFCFELLLSNSVALSVSRLIGRMISRLISSINS
jgi:hypothetical protein